MMRALVVGASGFVGEYLRLTLLERGHHAWGTCHSFPLPGLIPLDVRDREATASTIGRLDPDVVFVPAATANVEKCEVAPEESYRVNVVGLGNIIDAAVAVGAKLVHFSSEYVFDGGASDSGEASADAGGVPGRGGPYSEDDPPRPLSIYGLHKLAGETAVLDRAPGGLVLRTTVVYGWERRGSNFVHRLVTDLRAGGQVRVPRDQVSSPTYVVDLARAACELAELNAVGVYNVAGSELASRYDFALAVAETFGLDGRLVTGVPTRELEQRAPRPLKAGLKVEKVARRLGWAPAGFREGLTRMKKEEEGLWKTLRIQTP